MALLTGSMVVKAQSTTPANSVVTNKQERTISVSGTAEMEVVPDEIYVQISLREYKKGNNKVDIETIRNNFLRNMQALGYTDKEISVQSYSGWDGNAIWYSKKKKNPDLLAGINYWVKVASPAKMDEIVAKLDDEATTNFSIAKVSHSRIEEFKKQLKMEAVRNAKAKAVYLAAAVNEKVGQAITINDPAEPETYQPRLYNSAMMMRADAAGGEAAPMNVDFKKIKLEYSVNAVFALQ